MITNNEIDLLKEIANSIRGLSIDAIEAANSGHPGICLGCAEIAAYLFAKGLRYNPDNPTWFDRDRFILSAGHGSMLLYSSLHLAGYNLSLDDIKNFRKLHSPTAGHPEYQVDRGIETTTGPLGQGIAMATGMALGHKIIQSRLGLSPDLTQASFIALAGDGCIMEGISSEAASFAGHLKLDNLIIIYDSNDICLDGPTSECFSENTQMRYEAYGWKVIEIEGHDFKQIDKAIELAKGQKEAPTLIIAKTIIGKGSPSFSNTNEVHGKPLGKEETILTKQKLGIPLEPLFFVPQQVKQFFQEKRSFLNDLEQNWLKKMSSWANSHPGEAKLWQEVYSKKTIPSNIEQILADTPTKPNAATRENSSNIIQTLSEKIPFLIGGSADLSGSDKTFIKNSGIISSNDYKPQNIKFGVREFSMSAISAGLALHGTFLPFCGTFLTFSDYMRNSIRLNALMKLNIIYQFTHDSFFLGEDGPTHQPIEHLASLRAIPNVTVIRPADSTEVKGAWYMALKLHSPVVLSLSRQSCPDLASTSFHNVSKGAYIIKKETKDTIDVCILASGSEVALALKVAEKLEPQNISVRVVSFPSFELFELQDKNYQKSVLGEQTAIFCSIEAGISFGWHKYTGPNGVAISIEKFGESGPQNELADHFGFTVEKVSAKILNRIND
ncbi:transketolase [Candidatus Margulisiibacteriota bacterium]